MTEVELYPIYVAVEKSFIENPIFFSKDIINWHITLSKNERKFLTLCTIKLGDKHFCEILQWFRRGSLDKILI